MTVQELRDRAHREAEELGPEPADMVEHSVWVEERRGAIELLAALTDWDAALLQRAAIVIADEWESALVSRLLFDAAEVCQVRGHR